MKKNQLKMIYCNSEVGRQITEDDGIIDRWKKYFCAY